MRDDKQIFIDWLTYAIKIEGIIKGKDLAKRVGVNPGTISGYITGKSKGPRSIEDRIKICEALNVDYHHIISSGVKHDLKKAKQPIDTDDLSTNKNGNLIVDIDPITTDHRELVGKFSSKRIALEANRKMVELDLDDPMRFAELVSIIGKFVKGADFVEIRKENQDINTTNPYLKTGTKKNV